MNQGHGVQVRDEVENNGGRNVRPRLTPPTDLEEEWERDVFPPPRPIRRVARRTPFADHERETAFQQAAYQRHIQQLREDFIRWGMPTSPVTEAEDEPAEVEVIDLDLDE